ncbi:MAG: hypothetical protein ACUVTL_09505 [Thermoproteota archaeon]
MSKISKWDELRRVWFITIKDMKIYYWRPSAVCFSFLFPFTLFLYFTAGREIPLEKTPNAHSPDSVLGLLFDKSHFDTDGT